MALGQEEIGARIKQARDEMGLTQQEFAERIGLKNGANVSRLERGVDELTSKRLRRLVDATTKPAEFFVREEPQTANGEAGLLREALEQLADVRASVERIEAALGAQTRERQARTLGS